MPELPEVEITRRGFAEALAGARITALRLGKPLRWPLGCAPSDVVGRQLLAVRRRGKYLLLDLNEGLLMLHLGMSGSLRFVPGWPSLLPEPGAHDHVDIVTTQGSLRLNDPRRFGALVYSASAHEDPALRLLARLGPEPLEPGGGFAPATFHAALRGRKTSIKQLLLAGELVVGVGNIYACEALFHAGIRPTTAGQRISLARATRLHDAIRAVLQHAVDRGGSTLRNFSHTDGQSGHFQVEAMVYGRADQACRVCGHPIKLLRQGQRSSFFCAYCQKP